MAHVAPFDARTSEKGGDSNERMTYGSLGLRTQAAFDAGDLGLRFSGAAASRHAFGDRTPAIDLAFAASLSFTVSGVPIDKDTIVLDPGLEADINKAVSFGVSYSGRYGDRATDHGALASLNWRF
jgi:outer membrane autotransporter protein